MNPTDDHQDPVPPPALSERIKALGDKGVPPISGAIGRDIAKIRGLIGPDLKIRGLAGSNLTAGAIKSVLDSSIVRPKGAELTKIMGNLAANSAQAAERRAVDYNAIASRVRLPSPEVQALQTMVTQAEEQS
ncbi:MAG: hypothetical protein Q7S35_01225, partial [Candidatus Limnocylindrales bacterium]|nr:hypothetical protein [Candidatus Limnocylindrales bacterium]